MDKGVEKQEQHTLDDFNRHVNLWNIVPSGSGKAVVMLRKIVDSIHARNHSTPYEQPPSVLIHGATGKRTLVRALVNSLAIEDARVCMGKYFDNGIWSFQFFWNSYPDTAHIIFNVEQLKPSAEATLWKYIHDRVYSYYNNTSKAYDNTVGCNGLILMTAESKDKIPEPILKATTHIIELEPFTQDQILSIIHQKLVFAGIEYGGEEVLKALYEQGFGEIKNIIPALKRSLLLMNADLEDKLTLKLVEKAERLFCHPVSHSPPKFK
jgi:hypothetical protein